MNVNNGMARTYQFTKKKKHRDANEIGEAEDDEFSASTPALMLQFTVVNDDDIERFVSEMLSLRRDAEMDVLDIRRQLPEAIRPDARHSIHIRWKN